MHDQQGQWRVVSHRCQPSGGRDTTAPVEVHLLAPSRWHHAHAAPVVNQGEDDALFEALVHRLALPHIEAPGGFPMRKLGFTAPLASSSWANASTE